MLRRPLESALSILKSAGGESLPFFEVRFDYCRVGSRRSAVGPKTAIRRPRTELLLLCAIQLLTSTASSRKAACIATLQLNQVRNIPADAPQFRPREMPPLGAISADGDQHVELCGDTAQRRGVYRK